MKWKCKRLLKESGSTRSVTGWRQTLTSLTQFLEQSKLVFVSLIRHPQQINSLSSEHSTLQKRILMQTCFESKLVFIGDSNVLLLDTKQSSLHLSLNPSNKLDDFYSPLNSSDDRRLLPQPCWALDFSFKIFDL